MDPQGHLDGLGSSGEATLKSDVARQRIFEKILDQLADISLFSSSLSPTIFIVYAHNNEKEGTAYDESVRTLITWLKWIRARILSDQSPLLPFISKLEATDPIGNILANQMCLLPPRYLGTETTGTIYADKVIVCSSNVMEGYYYKTSTRAYIEEIIRICTDSYDQPTETTLESRIRAHVEKNCGTEDFHHVLTELAFLEARKSCLSETRDMVPVVLSQTNPDEAPMQYLPVFRNTDVKLKLKSTAASSLHTLFFKLLTRLFSSDKEIIQLFKECYEWVIQDLNLNKSQVNGNRFDETVNRRITKAYQEYWKLCCVVVRDGKLQAYTGKLSDQMSQVLENVNQSTRREILKWLSPISASELHGKYHDSGSSRVQGTCDWVIRDEQFCQWHRCEGSALLLLRGEMGTGKTYSTSRVIDWVKQGISTSDNDEALAYFYCNRQDPTRSESKGVLRSLVRQLSTGKWKESANNTAVHKLVHKFWLKGQGQGIDSTFAEWEACLRALIDTYPRTTIVLDALDECNELQRQDLINLLVNLATRKSDSLVKVFVSARPDDDVRRHLEKYYLIRMQEEHNAEDIANFVRTKLSEHRRWSKLSPVFQDEMVDKLLEKSGNMFLFASLQIQRLRDCNTQDALRKRLSTLPNSLSKIYEEIYHRAASEPEERKFLERALRWVLCSARPLTTDELLFAVSQDSESNSVQPRSQELDEDMMLGWTHNLLILDVSRGNGHPVWRLAHQAVAGFLENSTWCNSALSHCEAGKVCLMILLDAFGANREWSNTNKCFEDSEDFECPCPHELDRAHHRLIMHKELPGPLAEYAVYGWPTHVRAQKDGLARDVDELSQTLRKFLGQPEEAGPAYKRWFKHAFEALEPKIPGWSIFKTRLMPGYSTIEDIMAPTILACHLGLYTCLLDWWSSDNIDYDRISYSRNPWHPSRRMTDLRYGLTHHRWSPVSLACVHNETHIIKHLLGRKVRVNTNGRDEVPPIVAAAVADSVEAVERLIELRADICSTFTLQYGHVLRFAMKSNSLGVTRLLLQQPGLFKTPEVEAVLTSFGYKDFQSAEALELLMDMGVHVNTPLSEGTLLLAAVQKGWEKTMCNLLEKGAEVNAQTPLPEYQNVFEAFIDKAAASPKTVRLFMKHGAQVNSSAVAMARTWAYKLVEYKETTHPPWQPPSFYEEDKNKREVLDLLLSCEPDLNETWTHCGVRTSALTEAIKHGDLAQVQLLFAHDAKLNLNAKIEHGDRLNPLFRCDYGDPLGCLFRATLTRRLWERPYPVLGMINELVKAGASLQSLEGDRLHTALAAAAFAGLEDMVQDFLKRGASPYTDCDHKYRTALSAAAASDHPQAPAIVRTLLNSDVKIMKDCGFSSKALFSIDYPLLYLISLPESEDNLKFMLRPEVWLESVSVLALQHAIGDIDFVQWKKCLKLTRPKFCEKNAELLEKLEQTPAKRTDSFLRFPAAASDKQWAIKDARNAKADDRDILRCMKSILNRHENGESYFDFLLRIHMANFEYPLII